MEGNIKEMGLKMSQREGAYKYKGEKERDLKSPGETNSLAYSEECHGDGRRVGMENK